MYPVFLPEGFHLDKSDIKVFIGIFIILNFLWLISYVKTFYVFIFNRKYFSNYDNRRWCILCVMLDWTMVLIWGTLILIFLGTQVSKLL